MAAMNSTSAAAILAGELSIFAPYLFAALTVPVILVG
jgi:hypothetical protein